LNKVTTIDGISVIFATMLLAWSFVSLESAHIDVITQSPFFLYDNVVYTASIAIATAMIVLVTYIRRHLFASITLLFTLWSLLLMAPYMVYLRSLPLYNDQLGFVLEVFEGVLHGHIRPIQGELSSLGHAYFTSIYTLVCGFDPLWGVVAVQLELPMLYVLPLLAVKRGAFHDKISVTLVVLAAILNPIFYGRTPFAWFYLILLTFYLYNTFLGVKVREGPSMIAIVTFTLIYVAYVISDPTSLIVPIMLFTATLFNRKLVLLTVSTVVTWFAVNATMYISGSLYSVIVQLMALIEHPASPLPLLVAPAVNPIIKLYNYLRELAVFLNFLISLISAVVIAFKARRDAEKRNELTWATLYLVLVALQATALAMNRWGMVPYSIHVLTTLPVLALIAFESKLLKIVTLLIAIPLLALSPTIKWGSSPIAFPTPYDLSEMNYLVNHMASQITVCASGAHVMADFYYKLHSVSAPLRVHSPLPQLRLDQIVHCDLIAVFYRSFNIYRLDISRSQLTSIITEFDRSYSIIYRNDVWTIWLR